MKSLQLACDMLSKLILLFRITAYLYLLFSNYKLKFTMYQRKVDVDMLDAVKSVLADVSSV